MLVSFGTFWAGEGVGVHWPGSDLAIPVLVAAYGLATWALVATLERSTRERLAQTSIGRASADLRSADAADTG
jgi:hypothetical protein